MAERIRQYIKYIDELLKEAPEGTDFSQEAKKHLVQIAFFAHERFIHLIVTVVFAILTVIIFLYIMSNPQPMLFLLLFLFVVLLVPYIKHYYLLENSVQKMYEQYDEMLRLAGEEAFLAHYKNKK